MSGCRVWGWGMRDAELWWGVASAPVLCYILFGVGFPLPLICVWRYCGVLLRHVGWEVGRMRGKTGQIVLLSFHLARESGLQLGEAGKLDERVCGIER